MGNGLKHGFLWQDRRELATAKLKKKNKIYKADCYFCKAKISVFVETSLLRQFVSINVRRSFELTIVSSRC